MHRASKPRALRARITTPILPRARLILTSVHYRQVDMVRYFNRRLCASPAYSAYQDLIGKTAGTLRSCITYFIKDGIRNHDLDSKSAVQAPAFDQSTQYAVGDNNRKVHDAPLFRRQVVSRTITVRLAENPNISGRILLSSSSSAHAPRVVAPKVKRVFQSKSTYQ